MLQTRLCLLGGGGILVAGSLLFPRPGVLATPAARGSQQAAKPAQPASDWPVFRGNAHQTGVAPAPLPDKLEILWQFDAKRAIEGTAAIAGGVVYVGCEDEYLYALSLADGSVKWKYKTGGAVRIGVSVNGDAVYVGDDDGKFHCVDAKTGAKRWMFDTDADITSAANFDGHRVLFGCGDQMLYCFDKDKGGKPLWTFKVPGGPVMGSPAIINNRTFVAGCDSALHVIDTTNGNEIKSVELDGQVGATPALIGNFLYVGTMTNQVQAIDWKEGKVAWSYEAKKKQQPFYASVAATDTLVLAGGRDKLLHALDRKTGDVKWTFPTGGRVDSSPVVAGQRVYVGSLDGKLYVVDLGTGKQVQVIELGKQGILASPAVSGDRLVIGTVDGVVYCLGKKQ
jgi:outer membrane protein assembly factor BamB